MSEKILNLGSGKKIINKGIRLDINPDVNPDVLHDLNKFPYPFKNNTFDLITMDNVIGELDNLWKVMDEVHRISKDDAKIIISVPYFRSSYAFIHPNIKSFFTVQSFDYFDPENELYIKYKYTKSKFKVEQLKFNENFKHGTIKSITRYLANKYPKIYENFISHLIPLDSINFYLRKV